MDINGACAIQINNLSLTFPTFADDIASISKSNATLLHHGDIAGYSYT